MRGEWLGHWVFADGAEAQQVIKQWRQQYNKYRLHRSLGYLPRLFLLTMFDPHSNWLSLWGQINDDLYLHDFVIALPSESVLVNWKSNSKPVCQIMLITQPIGHQ